MKYYFFDSSVLAKVFAPETGSSRMKGIVKSARLEEPRARIFICDLALPESVSALSRKHRETGSGVSRAAARRYRDRLIKQVSGTEKGESYLVLDASTVMERAARFAFKHELSGADSIQLAAAIAARDLVPHDEEEYEDEAAEITFATADQSLATTARAEGFPILNPSE